MQGYQDRSKYREVVGTKYARELMLKLTMTRHRADSVAAGAGP